MMKATDLAIIAILIFLGISVKLDIDQRRLIQTEDIKSRYKEIMFNATEDASIALFEPDSAASEDRFSAGYDTKAIEINPNLNKSLTKFYDTLYANMGIVNDPVGQDAFKMYVPVKMVVAYDGLFVNSWQEVFNSSTTKKETVEMWSLKKPYIYYDNQYKLVINFTLDDRVYVFNITTGVWEEGRQQGLYSKYPGKVFSPANFDNLRRQTIVEALQKELACLTVRYNNIAKSQGIGYQYNIPIIDEDTWNNTIKDVCFIAFLQGLSIGMENYNTFGSGGTRVKAAGKYYGNTICGVKYYHEETCPLLTSKDILFDSRTDAAKQGYYHCGQCNP